MNLLGLRMLFYKETLRFSKVYLQTLMAPMVTSLLYLLVFSHVLSGKLDIYEGISYASFLIPGLMMMSMIQNAFANSSSSLIQSKVTGNLIFILLPPISHLEIFIAFVAASVLRGMIVGFSIYIVAIFFTDVPIFNAFYILLFAVVASATLGALGIIAGIWAEKFDQLAGFNNFIIMPLSFLSGVFYSIHSLPPVWQMLSHLNPFFYMIDGFRYGFFGVSDIKPIYSLGICLLFFIILTLLTLHLLRSGYKLRN